jgi:uncharacterized protein YacL
MPNTLLSAVLVISCAVFGGLMGHSLSSRIDWVLLAAVLGLGLGLGLWALVKIWLRIEAEKILGGAAGTLAGSILASVINSGLAGRIETGQMGLAAYGLIIVTCSLVGMQLGVSKAKELVRIRTKGAGNHPLVAGILDTSVIIDGRIADVCETGFLSGDLLIPEFVLKELQGIADSSETTKRTRGRRGLDILSRIRKQSHVSISIDTRDYPGIRDVDQKLIAMAKETGHAILTNDFNLNKVAEVHSIQVLNMNQLANALKPIVLPGEHMRIQILKEGKEPGQGVAYLDDGTMVVVEQGRRFVGKFVEATVTSVLQTPAGRMIFASVRE